MAKVNSVGAGETPRLGVGKPEGLARPGGTSGDRTHKAADFGSVGRPARPGGPQSIRSATGGTPPRTARPGGAQKIGK